MLTPCPTVPRQFLSRQRSIMALFIFRFVRLPEELITLVMYVLMPELSFTCLTGTYLLCEFIWPKRMAGNQLPPGMKIHQNRREDVIGNVFKGS